MSFVFAGRVCHNILQTQRMKAEKPGTVERKIIMAKIVYFLIVLDSAGVGYEPDADRFGDVGSDTFGTCIRSGRLYVPNMEKMGLFHIEGTSFERKGAPELGCCGQAAGAVRGQGHDDGTLGDRGRDITQTDAYLSEWIPRGAAP